MAAAGGASAQTGLSGEAVFEFQLERGSDSDDPGNERTNAFGRTEVAPTLTINEHFFVDGVAVFEPIQAPPPPGEDAFMDHEGVFAEEIKANYVNGPYHVFAGKFNPQFGTAWNWGRGIWSEDFAEGYEITEKIGFGGALTVGNERTGEHTLVGSTFFADTSFLSDSALTARGRTRKADGGASNTEDFSSFVTSLHGANVAGVENLSYHLAYRHLGAGDADLGGRDEKGVAATVSYIIPFSDNLQSDALLEYAAINNVGGSADDVRYYTASIVNTIKQNWNVTLGYTKRDTLLNAAPDNNDHLFQLSGGYDFGNGLTLETGWKKTEVAGVDTNIIGGLARYTVGF